MKNRVALSLCTFVCLLLASTAACSRESASEPPVAAASVTLGKDKAAIGSPLKITYKFDVAPGAKIDGDYSVFVHVIEPDGERLWQDDHQPEVPTSKWTPGQTVEYTAKTGRMASMNRYTSLDTSKLAVTTHYTYDERGRVRPYKGRTYF